jgi:hypothetical protein
LAWEKYQFFMSQSVIHLKGVYPTIDSPRVEYWIRESHNHESHEYFRG